MSATGVITANTHRQLAASTSHPPSNGPIAVDTADDPAQRPMAVPRSSSLNDASSIARLLGTSIAPAEPCTNRSARRIMALGASAHPAVAIAKPIAPMIEQPAPAVAVA